jgi:hypothetical protein
MPITANQKLKTLINGVSVRFPSGGKLALRKSYTDPIYSDPIYFRTDAAATVQRAQGRSDHRSLVTGHRF